MWSTLSSTTSLVQKFVGFITLNYFAYKVLRFAAFYFLPSSAGLKKYKRSEKSWAIVTGSSGGIGFGYAQELISHGFGVILLAHILDEVDAAEAKLRAEFPDADICKIVIDARLATSSDIGNAIRPYLDLPITILINNVAVTGSRKPFLKPLTEFSAEDVDSCINVNTRFCSQLTRILLPTLSRSGPSLILTMTSAARTGFALLSIYSATKCYGNAFSIAVARECEVCKHNIDTVAILPGDVHSDGNVVGVAPGSPTSRQFARMVIDRLGRAVSWGEKELIPYWKHALQTIFLDYLPTNMADIALAETIGKKKILMDEYDQLQMERKKQSILTSS